MLPKFMLEGLVARKPGVAGVPETADVPVPAREIVVVLKRRLLRFPIRVDTTDIFPLAPPADSGVKVAAKRTLCPGATVIGNLGPL
jgi:hypothetical protein